MVTPAFGYADWSMKWWWQFVVTGPRDLGPTFKAPKGNCNHDEENIDGTNACGEVRTGTQNEIALLVLMEKKKKLVTTSLSSREWVKEIWLSSSRLGRSAST